MISCVVLSLKTAFVVQSHLRSLQSACNHKLQGIKDELKHIDKSLKQNAPEHNKVLWFQDLPFIDDVTSYHSQ